ncbi:hypothetical protein DMENIID0001_065570 [Sergentomyia squamirostris]
MLVYNPHNVVCDMERDTQAHLPGHSALNPRGAAGDDDNRSPPSLLCVVLTINASSSTKGAEIYAFSTATMSSSCSPLVPVRTLSLMLAPPRVRGQIGGKLIIIHPVVHDEIIHPMPGQKNLPAQKWGANC